MKRLKNMALLACASLGLMGARSLADPLTYAQGDLLLGFRASGGTGADKCYVVNLGQASALAAGPITGLGNIATDLDATFGSGWDTRTDLFWGISGTNTNLASGTVAGEPARTLFATRAQLTPGTLTSGWARQSSSGQGIPAGKMVSLANYFAYVNGDLVTAKSSTANSPKGSVQNKTDVNSYASYQPGGTAPNSGGIAYTFFNPSIDGTPGQTLELHKLNPATGAAVNTPSQLVGTFTLSPSGVVTFTPASTINDSVMHLDATSYSVAEDGTSITVNVIRGGGTGAAADVVVNTSNNTAIAGTDYMAVSSFPVHFNAGETSKPVTVNVSDRAGFQGNRSFRLSLSGATGGSLIAPFSNVLVTITDKAADTVPGVIEFSSATYSFNRTSTAGSANVTLTRSNAGPAVAVTVSQNGGTILPAELAPTTLPAVVNFANGETSKQFTISYTAIPTTAIRTVILDLSGPTNGATLGAIDSTTATILKQDTKKPTVAITSPAGSSVTAPGTFNLTGTVNEDGTGVVVTATFNGASLPLTVGAHVANTPVAFSATANPLQAENGTNTIVITAVDDNGNTTIVTKNISFANTSTFTPLAGTYNGVVLPTSQANTNHDTTGFMTVNVTTSGSFTGKLTISGINRSFSGLLRNSGVARFKNPSALTDYYDVIDVTEFESYIGALAFTLAGGQITGTLSEHNGGNVLSAVTANLVPYKSTNLLTGALLNQGTKGYYTVAVLSKAQTPSVAPNLYPQGDGAAGLTLTNTGKATLKGFLADGTAFTAAGAVSSTNTVALHTPLYRKSGSLTGLLVFNLADLDTDVEATDMLWIRPARPRARYYPAGWPTSIVADAIGTAYNSPADLNFGQDATGGAGSATLDWSLAGLGAPVVRPTTVNSGTGAVTLIAPLDHTLKLTTTSGLFNGTFTYAPGVVPGYKGALINKAGGSLNRGYGYFLSIPALTYGASGESGLVKLLPTP